MATTDRGGDAVRAGEAVAGLFGGPLGRGLSAAAKAARAWYAANGDRERAHTTGVWLRKPGATGADPVLVVELDSNLLAYELGTNKELYLSRMAYRGIAISDIRFRVGKTPAGREGKHPRQAPGAPGASLSEQRRGTSSCPEPPRLTDAETRRVELATRDLPDGLRQSVSRAMCASLRRSKASYTQET